MPITVTQESYARACGIVRNTACARLKNVAHTGSERPFNYHLAAVLPTLTARDRLSGAVQCLFDVATVDDALFVGDDVIPVCQTFHNWLDPDQKQRLAGCRGAFTAGLYNSTASSEIWQFIDALHLKLCLHPGICRFIATGDDAGLPDITTQFAFAFSLVNGRHFEPLTSSYKEAA